MEVLYVIMLLWIVSSVLPCFLLSKLNFLFLSLFYLPTSLADFIWFIAYFIQGWLIHTILIHMLICSWDNPPWLEQSLIYNSFFALHSICLILSQQPNAPWKTKLYHTSHPLDSVDPSHLFPAMGKAFLG